MTVFSIFLRSLPPVFSWSLRRDGLVALGLVLTACSATPVGTDQALEIDIPSARIETREGPTVAELEQPTRVVVLGTGTPIPDARRAGPGIAVIHRGETYLFDVGAGTVRNATIARYRYDIPSLYPSQICCVFLTHLHSDHTIDLAELVYTLWWRRAIPVRAWGPTGLARVVDGMTAMMAPDTEIRTKSVQPVANPTGYLPDYREITEGVVLRREGIVIEAFEVNHGDIKPAFGYRVTTPDLSIVISGDTAYSQAVVDHAKGVDILFHEVISREGLKRTTPFWQRYHTSVHTLAEDVARIAAEAAPGRLVLYHGLFYGAPESSVLDEVKAIYPGEVTLANDLDVFD